MYREVVSVAELPTIEIFSAEFERDPFSVYADLRSRHWIARCELGYIVVGHDAVAELLKDRRLGTAGAQVADLMGASDGPWGQWISSMLLNTSTEAHARLRRLVLPTFTPKRANANRQMMREVFTAILEPHLGAGQLDVVADLCAPFPIRVLCNMIGVDPADVPRFAAWVDTLGKGYDLNPDLVPELDAAVVGMREYVRELVSERAVSGQERDDLVQSLVTASEGGDRLSKDELITMIILLLGAGADTTANQLANTVHALVAQRDQWPRLVGDPSLVPSAVEEALRFHPVVGTAPRVAVEDLELRGVVIPAGSFLLLSLPSAGRDPSRFSEPDRFDPTRTSSDALLAFGLGPHYCLGAHIARAELEEALDILVHRVDAPALAGPVAWNNPLGVWGPSTMPLRFRAACG